MIEFAAHINLLCLCLMRPLVIVRLNLWCTSSIGHMCSNTENTLAKLQLGLIPRPVRAADFWFSRGQPSNKALSKIQRRRFRVLRWPALFRTYELLNSKKLSSFIIDDENYLNDYEDVMARARPELAFSIGEVRDARRLAREIGLKPEEPFVCFHIRDGAYDRRHSLDFKDPDDPRNHDCEAFVPAIQAVIESGINVIRLGSSTQKPVPISSARFVDFALFEELDSLLDIYLGAFCEFFVSTCSGLDEVARVFRRPLVFVNEPSWVHLRREIPNSIHVLQNIRHADTGEMLNQSELHSLEIYGPTRDESDPRRNNLNYVKNTPEEIKNAVVEMLEWRIFEKSPLLTTDHLFRQRQFWSIHSRYQIAGDKRQTRTIISPSFLVANPHWCE